MGLLLVVVLLQAFSPLPEKSRAHTATGGEPFRGFSVPSEESSSTGFSFAAVGDFNFSSRTAANWKSLSSSGVSFVLGLGDFLYHRPPPTEQSWCNDFKGNITDVELVVGNHETLESNTTYPGGGSINKFLEYCPFTLGTPQGTYGFQYYFDYPATNPLARFILVDPAIWLGKTATSQVSYNNGTVAQKWVNSTIDAARTQGIPWVIVGMHKDCIDAGPEWCEIGQDLMRFLIAKKVDLVLQGHDHAYERSKQLVCATSELYLSSCVANDGSSGAYSKGSGTIFLVDGTGGADLFPLRTSDPDYPYFARANNDTFGYTKFIVTPTSISAQFVNTLGKFTDSWAINQPGTGAFTLSLSSYQLTSYQKGTGEWPSANATITLTSFGGYTGNATLTAAVTGPNGPYPTATFSPKTILLQPNVQASAVLTVGPPVSPGPNWGGFWTIQVNTTINQSFQVASLAAIFQSSFFTIQAPSNTPIIFPGSEITEDIQVQSHNSLADTVNFHSNLDPDFAHYLTVSYSPPSIALSANSTYTVEVRVSVSSDALGVFGCRCSIQVEGDGTWWTAYAMISLDIPTHTYPAGVQPGMWANYTLSRGDGLRETIRATIIQVQGSNITFNVDTYDGGELVSSVTTWIDIVTGQNLKPILPFFLIAGNLTEGLPIYETNPYQSIMISVYSTEPLAGTLRPTSGAQTEMGQPGANVWWDMDTGLLAHFDATILVNNEPVAVHYGLADTNAWARLTAIITATPTKAQTPVTVSFTTQVSGGTSPYEFFWDFGDGQASTLANPVHAYTSPGNYSVTIRVRDYYGDVQDETVTIITWGGLTASLAASTTTGAAPVTVSFMSQVSGGALPYEFFWDFGDGHTSTLESPAHTYDDPGNYSVILRVRDLYGDTQNETVHITVTRNNPQIIPSQSHFPVMLTAVAAGFVVVALGGALVVRSRRRNHLGQVFRPATQSIGEPRPGVFLRPSGPN